MRSSKQGCWSITARSGATFTTPSRCCWRWAIATRPRSRPTAHRTRSTDKGGRSRATFENMEFKTFVFYFLSAVMLLAALRVITVRNPVHAALFLVLTFFSAGGIWLLLQAEFLAVVLVLVYVGAVMVLFLFVVMMLDINLDRLRERF